MKDLLSELERAIRNEYDGKIAELEGERDRKIAAARSLSSVLGDGEEPSSTPRAPRPKRPARAPKPSASSGGAETLGKRIQRAILERTESFTINDLELADPEFADRKPTLAYHLKNLVARGELRVQDPGAGNRPATYVRKQTAVPSKAARPSRSLSEPAAVSA